MTRVVKKPEDIKDEPGAEERFMRGVKKALKTPPKPHEELKGKKAKQRKNKLVRATPPFHQIKTLKIAASAKRQAAKSILI